MFPFLPTVVVTVAILWLTLAPHPLPDNDLPLFEGADKVVHFLMFGGLAAALCFDVRRSTGRLSVMATWLIALAVSLFGGVIEMLQNSMEMGRSGDYIDFTADALGAYLCAFVCRMLLRRFF